VDPQHNIYIYCPATASEPEPEPTTRTVLVMSCGITHEIKVAAGWRIDEDSRDLTVYGVDEKPLATFHNWTSVAVKAAVA
jgi:hypothetical protein